MKRAFLVFGPESAGNRLVTRILCACGCYGDGQHAQRLNDAPPTGDGDIAWFRSVPYAGGWPDLVDMIARVTEYDYEVMALVLTRDVYATARSQAKTGHVNDIDAAYRNISNAYKIIFDAILHARINYVIVSYESLFLRQTAYLGWLLAYLDLRLIAPVEKITDQNGKHYANP